jgi:hypothetical protein
MTSAGVRPDCSIAISASVGGMIFVPSSPAANRTMLRASMGLLRAAQLRYSPSLRDRGLQSSVGGIADITEEPEHIQQIGFARRVGANDIGYITQPDIGVLKVPPVLQDQSLDEHSVSVMAVVERALYSGPVRSTIQ